MNINSELTRRRMGYGDADTYSAIGLIVDGERAEFALVQRGMGGQQQVIVHNGCDPDEPNVGGSEVIDCADFSEAMRRYNEAFTSYIVGKRVRLVNTKDTYPVGIFRPGLTGTVTWIEKETIAVKLDEPREELSSWENELHWCDEGCSDADGRDCVTIESFLQDVEFIDGDVLEVPAED